MEPLRELFRHHAWATTALIEHCERLPPEVLAATVPGTMGSISDTLLHLVGADRRYLGRMTDLPPGAEVREGMELPLPELRARFAAQAALWEGLLDRVESLEVTIPARGDWPETPGARNLLLLQALHHGNDHRTQICTILGARGLEAPDLDGWTYWHVTHHGK